MKKAVKVLGTIVVVIVLVVVAALVTHPLWVGPLVKTVAEKVGPRFTGTPIMLTNCDLNLYSGHFELTGFDLSNPEGCSEKSAASLSSLKVDFDTASVLRNVVVVRSVDVSGIFASYVKGASGKYNFTEIGDNAKAATGSSEPTQVEPTKTKETKPVEVKQPTEDKKAEKASSGKKVVIERLSIGDIKVAVMGMKIPLLPGTIVLTDIGKKSNGASLEEVWGQVQSQVMQASGAAGQQLSTVLSMGSDLSKKGLDLGKQGIDLGKKGLDAGAEGVKSALDSAKKLDMKGATDALKNTGTQLKNVGDNLKNVGDGLKGLFGK